MHQIRLCDVARQGSTVTFHVEEAAADERVFQRPSFRFDFPEGVELDGLADDVLLNLFVGSISGPARAFERPLEIVLPSALPPSLAEMWCNHAQLREVAIGPLGDEPGSAPAATDRPVRAGVLFGGGKDSMFTIGVTRELFGASNVVPLSFSYSELGPNEHRVRRRRFGEEPFEQATGIEVAAVHTTLRAALRHRLSLHTGNAVYLGAAPVLSSAFGLTDIFHSNEMNHFWVEQRPDRTFFNNLMMRPEFDSYAASTMSAALGLDFAVRNLNFCVGKHGAFEVIVERYPELLPPLFMCESTLEMTKWCGQCWKCFEYVLLCLVYAVPCQIDIDRYVAESAYLGRLLTASRELEASGARGYAGNLPWSPEVRGADVHFPTFCHSFARLRLGLYEPSRAGHLRRRLVRRRRRGTGLSMPRPLRPATIAVLRELKAMYGNHRFSILDSYSPGHLGILGLPYAEGYEQILRQHLPRRDVGQFLSRDQVVSLEPGLRPDPGAPVPV